jgi:polysaccharide deacetylase 2 family uncharacterized protein YibQ
VTAYARRRPPVKRRLVPRRGLKRRRRVPLFFKVFVLAGVILALILLYRSVKQPPPFAERVKAVDQLILAELARQEIPQGAIQQHGEQRRLGNKTWTLSRWEVTLPQGMEAAWVASQLTQRIQAACPGVTFRESTSQDGARELDIKVDSLLAHHLIFYPPRIKPPPVRPPRPCLAIVVDDLGPDRRIAEELLRLDAPVTFAILPFQVHSRRIAQDAHAKAREVILHLPMEPRGFPLKDPGKGALFVAMSDRELLHQLRKDLDAVPYIVGVNNHMGSRFMEHGAAVRLVLGELKKRGLFFLDSRTTAKTEGYQIARELALLAGERDIFLDNENEVRDIRAQLEGLIRLARDHGRAIGICHPHPATITALKGMIARIKEAGIRIVPLSQALE